jgi:hypothetical protein
MLVEQRSGEQTIAIFERDHLTAMEMARKHQIVPTLARSGPDRWVMCAQNSNVTFGGGNRIRTGNGNDPGAMRDANRGLVNPLAPAADHCVTNSIHTHGSVMVPANRQNRCVGVKETDQVA